MSRIRTRFRALAITSLATVVLMTALSAEATFATDPVPSPLPSADATPAPSADSTPSPTADATPAPTADPTVDATPAPTADPTVDATPAPTADPTSDPAASPVADPALPPAAASPALAAPVAPARVSVSTIVTAYARSHLRAPYRHGSTGPRAFDCSGLMWRVFHEAGIGRKVSSTSARAIYLSYLRRGLASRRNPRVGDLVIWGRGSHVGLYIGHGYAISALTQGVRVHRVTAVFTRFTAYLHTGLGGVEAPLWRLQVATHIRSLRHTVRSVTLRADVGMASPAAGAIGRGTRLVILASRRDASGHAWFRILTLGGRTGWLLSGSVRR